MAKEAFHKLRVRLGGMHESSCTLKPRPDGETPAQLAALLRRSLNAAVVGELEDVPMCFAGAGVTNGEATLVLLHAQPTGLKVSVNAEDAIGGNLLLDELRTALEG